MEVQLVSPEQVLYTGDAPFLGALAAWPVRLVLANGEQVQFAVHGGFVEVSHNHVIILSDVAELHTQIDVERARAAKARAEEALRVNPDDADAVAALQRAEARLCVAGETN